MVKHIFIFLLFALIILQVHSAPDDKWEFWDYQDNENTFEPDNSDWNSFLEKYLILSSEKKEIRVNYNKVTAIDKKNLKSYISYLSSLDPRNFRKQVQKAYWINLYNALTVNIILENYPVKSIKEIKLSGIFSSGPWKKKVLTIAGKKISLDDIEHRILRPIWKDKRIHYAVNCASIGCPNLQIEAYNQENLERLLQKGESEFINSEKGVYFKDNKLILSSIYKWFSEDFGNTEESIMKYILNNVSKKNIKTNIKEYKGKIYYRYNWDLNEM